MQVIWDWYWAIMSRTLFIEDYSLFIVVDTSSKKPMFVLRKAISQLINKPWELSQKLLLFSAPYFILWGIFCWWTTVSRKWCVKLSLSPELLFTMFNFQTLKAGEAKKVVLWNKYQATIWSYKLIIVSSDL